MQVIAMAARKGGCGKTTLTTHLAVAALQAGSRVKIIDLDPQATAAEWADGRGDDPPDVISTQPVRLPRVLEAIKTDTDLVIIDTPPSVGDADLRAMEHADLVLIPCRIQKADISSVLRSHDKAVRQERPAFVIFNDEAPKRRKSIVEKMRGLLNENGIETAPVVIHSRIGYGESQDMSRTVLETDPSSTAAEEMRSLYHWVTKQLSLKTTKPLSRKAVRV